jgi:hypothetical protein
MGINVTWANEEQTTIRYEFAGTWEREDLEIAVARGYAMIELTPYRVNVIADIRWSECVPDCFPKIIEPFASMGPMNMGKIAIVVNDNATKLSIKRFCDGKTKLAERLILVDTVLLARHLLMGKDASFIGAENDTINDVREFSLQG